MLAATLALTISLSVYSDRTARNRDQVRFESLSVRIRTSVENRIREQINLLRSVAAFAQPGDRLDPDSFQNFAARLDFPESHRGMLAMGYAVRLDSPVNPEQQALLNRIRPPLAVAETGPPLRFVTAMVSPPTEINRQALGLDLYSEPVRREAIHIAIDTGAPTLTRRIILRRDQQRPRPGFLLMVPVYTGQGRPEEPAVRWDRIAGLVYAPFRSQELFTTLLTPGTSPDVHVEIFEGAPDRRGPLIFSQSAEYGADPAPRDPNEVNQFIRIANREFTVRCVPTDAFRSATTGRFVPVIPILGTIISFLLFSLSLAQRNAKTQADRAAVALRKEVEERRKVEAQVRSLNSQLEHRVEQRTRELRIANQELEAFVYSASHDLRAPLRTVDGFSRALLEDYGDRIPEEGQDYIARVRRAATRMDGLIKALLTLSRITRSEVTLEEVNLSRLALEAAGEATRGVSHPVEFVIQPDVTGWGDERMLHIVLDNLIGNAVKFTGKVDSPRVEFGQRDGVYFVRDNGVGFDPTYADKLFKPFERLHSPSDFPGTGIGLATVQRIVQRHGGEIWARGKPGHGAGFYFTLAAEGRPEPVASATLDNRADG